MNIHSILICFLCFFVFLFAVWRSADEKVSELTSQLFLAQSNLEAIQQTLPEVKVHG
jgi:hypothetical protein